MFMMRQISGIQISIYIEFTVNLGISKILRYLLPNFIANVNYSFVYQILPSSLNEIATI